MDDPGQIIVAGDLHGNTRRALHIIRRARQLLPGEAQPLILQAGDFGIWPGEGGRRYRMAVQEACQDEDVTLWFLDGNHECMDTQTRALTRRGFLRVDDIRLTDEVLSVDDAGLRAWQPITEIVRRPASALWRISTRGLSMRITDGHRVVGHPRGHYTGRWIEYLGKDVQDRVMTIVTGAINPLPDAPGITDDEIRLLAWCLTDAHFLRPYGYWRFYQRASHVSRVTRLLDRLRITYTESTRQRDITQIAGKRLRTPPQPDTTVRVTAEGSCRIRWRPGCVPPEAMNWSRRQVEVFLEEFVYCDGSTPVRARKFTHVLYCPETELRESVQALLVANGFRCTVSLFGVNDWRLNVCDRLGVDLDLRYGEGKVARASCAEEVWCLRVPNGRFFVEREGKPYLTGNCFPQIGRYSIRKEGRWGRRGAMYWLPRNTRWRWHGRTWHALGGAVSVDKAVRVEGESWWPEEEITEHQAGWAIKAGPADVMVTHDCPSGVHHSFSPPPRFWALEDLARSDVHRERLQRVVDAIQPRWLVHGHLHRAYQRMCDFGYGPVEVTGLDCDGGDGPNYLVLDTRTMTWEVPDEPGDGQ